MVVTTNFPENTILIELRQDEARELRRWLDFKNDEVNPLVEELSDSIFDFTYSPLRKRP